MIGRSNWALLVVLTLCSLHLENPEITLGILLGGIISIVNFIALSRIGASILHSTVNQVALAAKVLVKVTLLMGIVTAVLIWGPVEPIAFVVGISITVFSVIIGGAIELFKNPPVNVESTDA